MARNALVEEQAFRVSIGRGSNSSMSGISICVMVVGVKSVRK